MTHPCSPRIDHQATLWTAHFWGRRHADLLPKMISTQVCLGRRKELRSCGADADAVLSGLPHGNACFRRGQLYLSTSGQFLVGADETYARAKFNLLRSRVLPVVHSGVILPPAPPDSFAIVLRNGRRLELTWNALPHIADQLDGLLVRLEA